MTFVDIVSSIVLAVLGVGFIIFVHELGHFIAAKRSGIRVLTFSLGFDPTVFGVPLRLCKFRRGGTDYVIGLVPLGGYVRMAGEGLEAPKTGSPDEFASQPPWKRAVVLAAGASMNILAGFVLFIPAFRLGASFVKPEIGLVEPGDPAWRAGLREGDRVVAIDGERIEEYVEIMLAFALEREGEDRTIRIERDGVERDIAIRSEWNPERGLYGIGAGPGIEMRIRGVAASSPAEEAGLRAGDRILGVTLAAPDGTRIRIPETVPDTLRWLALQGFVGDSIGGEILLDVERDGAPLPGPIRAKIRGSEDVPPRLFVGTAAPLNLVFAARGDAARHFKSADEIAEIDGEPAWSVDLFSIERGRAVHGDRMRVRIRGRSEAIDLSRDEVLGWLAANELVLTMPGTFVRTVRDGSPAAGAGLRAGDRIASVAGAPVVSGERWPDLKGARDRAEIVWLRGEEIQRAVVTAGEAASAQTLGISFDERAIVGRVIPDSAAHAAGLRPGDRILRFRGRDVPDWRSFTRLVTSSPGSAPESVVVLRDGEETTLTIAPRRVAIGYLGVDVREPRFIRRAGLIEAFGIGAKQTWLWTKRIYMTLKGLILQRASAKNLQGPVGIVHSTFYMFRYGIGTLLYFLALISLNLGILNLLPIPILDGGHLMFLAVEKIKGSPVSERIMAWANGLAFALIIALALFVTFNDVKRLFGI